MQIIKDAVVPDYRTPLERADAALQEKGLGPAVAAYWHNGGWEVSASDVTGRRPSPHSAPEWDVFVPALSTSQGYTATAGESGEGPYLLTRQLRHRARAGWWPAYQGNGW